DERPRQGLRVLPAAGGDGEPEDVDGARPVAEERAQERRTGVRRQAGPQVDHALRGVGGTVVVAELDLGVGERAVVPPVARLERPRSVGCGQGAPEVVLAEQHPRTDAQRRLVVRIQVERNGKSGVMPWRFRCTPWPTWAWR